MQTETIFIDQVEVYKSRIKLKESFKISLGTFHHAENIVVVIRTNIGITGFGECSPFMTINGESIDTCFVVGEYIAKVLIKKNPIDIATCSVAMDALIYGNSSIKSAFDMALYDIASQNAGVPLYLFLGGKNNKQLITDYTVSIDDPDKMAADAKKIKDRGFQFIKIKLGGSKEKDIQRVKAIREKIGTAYPLRIDANQGWSMQTAIEILQALAPYGIQYCEEPIPRWDFMSLPELRRQSPIPIMADECCSDDHDAKRLIDLEACDHINIKLGKSGGIYTAQKIIRLAAQAGINMQIGGFLESRLAFTAAAHLALTSDNVTHCDFDTPLMFVEDPVTGGILYDDRGVITVPETAGLGATIGEAYLQRMPKVVVN